MKKANLIKEQQRLRMLENAGINGLSNANLISVDIQPEYENYMGFQAWEFMQYLNQVFDELGSLTFLYNGADTLGMVSESDYKMWLLEQGFEEENLNYTRFYDKGYAFFRYCMDEGMDDEDVVALVQYMDASGVHDSRDINWQDFMSHYGIEESEARDLLEFSGDAIHIPDLMEYLETYRGNLWLCGGGIHECLKEVEIALMALSKPYNVSTKWTY